MSQSLSCGAACARALREREFDPQRSDAEGDSACVGKYVGDIC